jgi:four helix bundle protein
MKDFRRLKVWEKPHQLTLAMYRATARFPREELYGLTSQMKRCCASIPANIAEGCGKDTNADFCRYLHIASGSASELEYHLLLARDLAYLPVNEYGRLNEDLLYVRRMLTSLINKVECELHTKPKAAAATAG